MPLIIPQKPRRGRPEKILRGRKADKQIEIQVRDELIGYVEEMLAEVYACLQSQEQEGGGLIKIHNAPNFTQSKFLSVLYLLKEMKERWSVAFTGPSVVLGKKWVDAVSARQKKKFEEDLAKKFGVDFTSIFDDQLVKEAAEIEAVAAASLIKTIDAEYFQQIEEAVLRNFQQREQPEGRSLLEQIKHIGDVSHSRASLIARDQTAKINIAVTQARNQELGIEEYVWRTAKDRRVTGTPGGKWPEGNYVHGNHYKREGKVYRWDSPPSDGHPGFAINCRCVADPIINMDKLNLTA